MEFINEVLKQIWEDRYKKNNETINENFKRVATYCGKTQEDIDNFYNLMANGEFFPAGRTMSNSGIGKSLTLNNCFVAPIIQDSLEDIFNKVSLGAKTHQRGGGIGYEFSQIRPKGTPTSNDAIASGALSFMDVFNAQTATILQGNRRGANMGIMNVYDMDILDFINAKSKDKNRLEHFNLSVMVDDDFMNAVKNNEKIFLHHPVYDNQGNILKNPSDWEIKKEVNACDIWNEIIINAYNNGEPGVFFYDNLNKDNNLAYIEKIICTNPCSEYLAGTIYGNNPITHEILNPNEFGGACNLGSLFIHNFVVNPFQKNAFIDFGKLRTSIFHAVRFLDNIIDINVFPDKIYENYQKNFRTIGLGYTGLADALVMLNLKYNSAKARDFVSILTDFIALSAYRASIALSKEKGSFPFLDNEKFIKSGFLMKHANENGDWKEVREDILNYGIRNAKILSVAPTGTLSLVFGNNCSSGIEPIFCLEYDRKVKMGGQQESDTKTVSMEDYVYHLWKQCPSDINAVNKDVFTTALEISVEDHIAMLSTIAYNVDMSVSKTINVPESYSFENAKSIYEKCWKSGIKGCTIFRPNSIRQGILTEKPKTVETKDEEVFETEFPRGVVEQVPEDLMYKKYKLETGCGSLYLFLGIDEVDGKLYDCFTNTDGTGGCSINTQANSRLLSLCLRGGIPVEKIIQQLNKSGTCPSFQYKRGAGKKLCDGKSCPSAIASILKKVLKESEDLKNEEFEIDDMVGKIDSIVESYGFKKDNDKSLCPECKTGLSNESGCLVCKNCGYSKCN